MSETQLDRKDLKIQALLEKVSSMTAQYENQVADLRVDLTIVSQELETYHRRDAEAQATQEDEDVEENQEDTPAK